MGRAGCRTTQSRRSQSESAKQSGATGLSAIILAGLPVGLHRQFIQRGHLYLPPALICHSAIVLARHIFALTLYVSGK